MSDKTVFEKCKVTPEDIKIFKPSSTASFCLGDIWIMKIEKNKIHFNREDFPDLTQDDFAKGVITILEQMKLIRGVENA